MGRMGADSIKRSKKANEREFLGKEWKEYPNFLKREK